MLELIIPIEVPVSIRHDTDTGIKYGADIALFNRIRLGFPFCLFFLSPFLLSHFYFPEERVRSSNVVTGEEVSGGSTGGGGAAAAGRAFGAERRKRTEERVNGK